MPLTQKQVEEVKQAVQNAMASIIVKNPFLGMLLRKTWIYVEDCKDTAYTNGLSIVLCYDWFSKIGKEPTWGARNQAFVLLHELIHIVLEHSIRQREYVERYKKFVPPALMNIVADAKVNQYVMELPLFKNLGREMEPITPEWLEQTFNIQNVKEKSFEEILDELTKKMKIVVIRCSCEGDFPSPVPAPDGEGEGPIVISIEGEGGKRDRKNIKPPSVRDVFREDKENKESEGKGNDKKSEEEQGKEGGKEGKERVPVNEGDKEDKDAEGKGEDELKKRWREKLSDTLISAKMAGMLPAGWERLINELLKPEVDWRRLLLLTLTKGIGSKVKRTWSRPSRKLPFVYPGKETLKLNKVLVLIDTSGSIGGKELKRFVSEVYGILKENAEVVVIPWDATAYDPIVLKSQRDVEKLKAGLRGGGGTCILPALKVVDSKFSNSDMVVIFSDWEIFDINDREVQSLLKKYASRILAFTTYKQPPEFLRSFKIRIS
jgi:predicted metal-dependent peptidase